MKLTVRDQDPDPVGPVDFLNAGSGTFFNGSGYGPETNLSKIMAYNIEFYAYLPKI